MNKTILLVDDDELILKSLSEYLEDLDYIVLQAKNGQEGLEVALAKHPDLVVTDMRMPELNGDQMLVQLRQDGWGKTVPALVLSADETTGTINEALKSGVTAYLSKATLSPEEMAQEIVTAIE